MAAIVALAREEGDRARAHAEAVERDDPEMPMTRFIAGRLEHADGQYEEALVSFEAAARALDRNGRALEGLHWFLGDTLARLDRVADAENAFREELRAFPRHIPAYASLAMLYYASGRPDAVKETLDALVVAEPTPEGYAAASSLWVSVGDPTYAAALRTDANTRFRGDPSLALFQHRR
jgi:tetratricopeptide (TPR) repeat protein